MLKSYSLSRIPVDEIQENWHVVREALLVSLPISVPVTEEVLSNCLQAILAQRLEVWLLSVKRTEGEGEWQALATTVISEDTISGTKQLVIYTLSGFKALDMRAWHESLQVLKGYAKDMGCTHIVAKSKNKRIIRICEKFGIDMSFRFMAVEV